MGGWAEAREDMEREEEGRKTACSRCSSRLLFFSMSCSRRDMRPSSLLARPSTADSRRSKSWGLGPGEGAHSGRGGAGGGGGGGGGRGGGLGAALANVLVVLARARRLRKPVGAEGGEAAREKDGAQGVVAKGGRWALGGEEGRRRGGGAKGGWGGSWGGGARRTGLGRGEGVMVMVVGPRGRKARLSFSARKREGWEADGVAGEGPVGRGGAGRGWRAGGDTGSALEEGRRREGVEGAEGG